jgi:serine protease AprX
MKPTSSGGSSRSNALWGRGGRSGTRGRLLPSIGILAAAAALSLPAAGIAAPPSPLGNGGAVVPASLLAQATANPTQVFQVIVQGTKGATSSSVASDAGSENGTAKKIFASITGAAVDISGKDLLKLARHPHVLSITPDQPIKTAGYQNAQMWPESADVSPLWYLTDPLTGAILGNAPQAPAIALVDSGIDSSKVGDFGSRVVASVNLCSLCTDGTTNDLEGHGTMVAGVLAGQNASYPGVAQNAPLVNVRTADANGESLTSDVISAADWILANKAQYNIKVANFSMAGATPTTFRFDPLDKAVEKLWFAGVTVVAAAGNFGTGTGPVDMSMAPGNDPFVITVGALDQQQTSDPSDDTVPWWSAYGYTADGFSKPDVAAPGRYMVMPVPMGATIPNAVPDRVVAPGYMWMSGTSFAAPVVAGAAAQILARHPDWGPDQVKGALMLTAAYLPNANWQQAGVGEADGASAALALPFTPPNPNENLDTFVSADPLTGQLSFNQAAWSSAVSTNAAWSSAAWSSAAWASAAWASAAWGSAAWSSAVYSANTAALMSSLATYSEATYAP